MTTNGNLFLKVETAQVDGTLAAGNLTVISDNLNVKGSVNSDARGWGAQLGYAVI